MVGVKQNTSINTGSKSVVDEIGKVGFYSLCAVCVVIGLVSLTALVAGGIQAGGIIPLLGMMVGAL